jgi:MFS superfamily sulfate permease-like transporter
MLPDPVLGVILFMAVIHMVDWRIIRQLCKLKHRGWLDLAALFTAFFGTCLFGVITGIAIAVGFSLVMFILNSTDPQIVELKRTPGSMNYKVKGNIHDNMVYKVKSAKETFFGLCGFNTDAQQVPADERVRILRFEAPLWFANIAVFEDILFRQLKSTTLKALVLDMSTVPWMDATAATDLNKIIDRFEDEDTALLLANTSHDIRQTIRSIRGDFCDGLFFESIYEAQAFANEGKVTHMTSTPKSPVGPVTRVLSSMRMIKTPTPNSPPTSPVGQTPTPKIAWP